MLATKILIHPSVSDFLEELPNTLITEGYLNIYENAELLVARHYLNLDLSTSSLFFSLYPPNLYVNDTPISLKQV